MLSNDSNDSMKRKSLVFLLFPSLVITRARRYPGKPCEW